jgi:hypothetical protein
LLESDTSLLSAITVAPSDDQITTQVLPINTLNLGTDSPTSINIGIGTTQPSSKFLIPVYVLASVIFIGLCVVVGFAVVCKIKITKRQSDGTSADLQRESRENYEIAEPIIYETINTSSEDLGMQIKMTNNDAYIQFHPSMGINVTSNKAYNVTNIVPMKQNSSYQVGHLQHFPKLNVAIDSYHSEGTEKQCKLDGTGLENPCTITTECLRVTVQGKGDSCADHIFDS